eukprot:jgi/Chrzof1/1548/Cz10g12020.t1
MAAGGVEKLRKQKGIRIRKGVRIKGIKITDSDSKKAALQRLKAEQAMRLMEVEQAPKPKAAKKHKKKAATTAAAAAKPSSHVSAPAAMEV